MVVLVLLDRDSRMHDFFFHDVGFTTVCSSSGFNLVPIWILSRRNLILFRIAFLCCQFLIDLCLEWT